MLGLVSKKYYDTQYDNIKNFSSMNIMINIVLYLIILIPYARGDIKNHFIFDIHFSGLMIFNISWTILSFYIKYTLKPVGGILVINISLILYMTLFVLFSIITFLFRLYLFRIKFWKMFRVFRAGPYYYYLYDDLINGIYYFELLASTIVCMMISFYIIYFYIELLILTKDLVSGNIGIFQAIDNNNSYKKQSLLFEKYHQLLFK